MFAIGPKSIVVPRVSHQNLLPTAPPLTPPPLSTTLDLVECFTRKKMNAYVYLLEEAINSLPSLCYNVM